LPTEAELAAISAALSVVLEQPVAVQAAPAASAWALASRQEAVGMVQSVAERAAMRGPLAP
jgi:hypothetical protein